MTFDQRGQTVAQQTNVIASSIEQVGDRYYQGLTVAEVATLMVELKRIDQPAVWDGRIPYVGLRAFQESDAAYFFGREKLVQDLLARVQRSRFVVIAGPSGSGKSSVARAGLFHALRTGRLERSEHWLLATMRPGTDPLENLAAALARATKSTQMGDMIRAEGLKNPAVLSQQIELHLSDDSRQRFVLLVDQFEETFTQVRDEARASAFINMLTTGGQATAGRAIIVLSVRSDFLSHFARYPELRKLISQQFLMVGAMTPAELVKAITLPALEVGVQIDAALVARIMEDMKGEPGALPLMSFALRDLFEAARTAPGKSLALTLEHYLDRGGIEQALERHADRAFASLSETQQELARNIFSRLVEVGRGRADTRRTATYAELVPAGVEAQAVREVVAALAGEGARLLTTSVANGTDRLVPPDEMTEAIVTIAHEKLIDAWPWLRRLVDENRETIALQNQIAYDAKAWSETQDAGFLYRGGRLIQVEEKLDALRPGLNEASQMFIDASLALREADRQQARRRRMATATLLTLLLMITAIAAVVFNRQATENAGLAVTAEAARATAEAESTRAFQSEGTAQAEATRAFESQGTAEAESARAFYSEGTAQAEAATAEAERIRAEEQAQIAQSQALARAADSIREDNPLLAAQLALEAKRISETDSAYAAVFRALPTLDRPQLTLTHDSLIYDAVWNNDKNRILTWGQDRTAYVWDAESGTLLLTLNHDDRVNGAAWKEDGSRILTWHSGGARVWDAESGGLLLILTYNTVNGAAWNSDEGRILTWGNGAHVWDERSGELLLTLAHDDRITGTTWNGDESRILTWGNGAHVWDERSGELLLTLAHDGGVYGAAWNGDESRILTWGIDKTVRVWNGESGAALLTLAHGDFIAWTDVGATTLANGAAWNNDESRILAWSDDRVAQIWDGQSGEPLITLAHNSWLLGASWNEDGSRILTWSEDGTARIWDGRSGNPLLTLAHDGRVFGAAWNNDESHILTWSEDGTARIWDGRNGNPLLTLAQDHGVMGAAWNGDESRVLTWSADRTVRVWNGRSRDPLLTLTHDGRVNGAAWNGDESRILTWGTKRPEIDGAVYVWDSETGEPLLALVHDNWVFGAAWNGDESRILTWSNDRAVVTLDAEPSGAGSAVYVWDAETGEPLLALANDNWIGGAAWNDDGSYILAWGTLRGTDGTVYVWDSKTGELLLALAHDSGVRGATWNAAGSRILTWGEEVNVSSADGTVYVWDVETGELLLSLAHESGVGGATWNNDESRILTWGATAYVWDAETGELLLTLARDSWVYGAAWNDDESRILTWSNDGTAKIWDGQSGEPLLSLTHDSSVLGATWNDDESRILTWSDDRTARIWDGQSGELLLTLTHDSSIEGAAWYGDGSRILIWGDTAHAWDATSGRQLTTLEWDNSSVTSAHWNRDKSQVMLTTRGGRIFRYLIDPGRLREAVCQRLPMNMNWYDWQRHFPGQPYRCTCSDLPAHPTVLEALEQGLTTLAEETMCALPPGAPP